MTLDMQLNVPEFDVTLYYHSSRPPNNEAVKKICESLDLAREIVAEANVKLSYALTDPNLHAQLQEKYKDSCIPDIKVAKEAALYHFGIDAPSPDEEFDQIMKVIEDTLDGLEGLKGKVTLSDVLSQYRWDLYKYYVDEEEVKEELPGKFRPKTKHQPPADQSRSGYVFVQPISFPRVCGFIAAQSGSATGGNYIRHRPY